MEEDAASHWQAFFCPRSFLSSRHGPAGPASYRPQLCTMRVGLSTFVQHSRVTVLKSVRSRWVTEKLEKRRFFFLSTTPHRRTSEFWLQPMHRKGCSCRVWPTMGAIIKNLEGGGRPSACRGGSCCEVHQLKGAKTKLKPIASMENDQNNRQERIR